MLIIFMCYAKTFKQNNVLNNSLRVSSIIQIIQIIIYYTAFVGA